MRKLEAVNERALRKWRLSRWRGDEGAVREAWVHREGGGALEELPVLQSDVRVDRGGGVAESGAGDRGTGWGAVVRRTDAESSEEAEETAESES